jgi:hypothetical protein
MEFVIWSMEHQAFWRPGRVGYSPTLDGAGRYPEHEARAIVARANYPPGTCHECMIPVDALTTMEVAALREENKRLEFALDEALREEF